MQSGGFGRLLGNIRGRHVVVGGGKPALVIDGRGLKVRRSPRAARLPL